MADKPTYQELEQRVISLEARIESQKTPHMAQRQADRYRLIFEMADDAIFILQDGEVKNPNPRAVEMSELLGGELERAMFAHCIHPEDKMELISRHGRCLRGGQPFHICQFRVVTKTGMVLWMEVNAVRIEWDGRPATLNVVRDISGNKIAEIRHYEHRKLDAVQTLAGGMAHAYNNLLMGIQGTSSLMSLDIGPRHRHFDNLKRIEYCVEEMAKLTSQLVGFARCGKYEERSLYLNDVIGEISDLFIRTRKGIRLKKDMQQDLWQVKGDKAQIEQVIVDILLNAWQAMPGAGDIRLKTENFVVNRHLETDVADGFDRYVKISISDSGRGMEKHIREKIFEPFFTTQKVRPGKGLGLASVYGIIKNHNGFIDVESRIGEGSTFTILLPAMDAEALGSGFKTFKRAEGLP